MKRLWLLVVLTFVFSACVYSEKELSALNPNTTTTAATTTTATTTTATTSVSATTSTAPPQERSSKNISYKLDAAEQGGTVAVNSNDCFDDDGPAECTPGVDITEVTWEPVAGAPDQLKVTITFNGPVGGADDFLLNMGIRGSESAGLGTNYVVEGGEVSWKFPGSDGPLPGELVSVDDQGRLVIIRDLSSLTGVIRIDVRTRTLTDLKIGDAVQISNVADRG